ncbi:hypothetical protein J8281_11625 [Aquimarina sp. U1-2]|uniref:toxin-antitoxin system YwqK family antitoxin n=1 Tax=Aquimarina sp. U1-2 TaxID=2823141 RepID=UPI001AED0D12|nr:hypothetical protein [Aquimarina sp. U1-2]MBP2832836.1 hypothetical protein [Aquimarina sp. U1-2]
MAGKYFKCIHKSRYLGIMLMVLAGCTTAIEPFNKKNVSDQEYKEKFQITDKKPKPNSKIKYYWYKSRKVHSSQGDFAGELLDGLYTKHFYTNALAEKGNFNAGKKVGTWKTWYKNGELATVSHYKSGQLSGRNIFFDSLGHILAIGKYARGKRTGKWVFPQINDTIRYRKGEVVVVKAKDTTSPGFFGSIFKKKGRDSIVEKRPSSFFKKLFSKKDNNPVSQKSKGSNKGSSPNPKKKKSSNSKKGKTMNSQQKNTDNKKKPNFFQRLFTKKQKENT